MQDFVHLHNHSEYSLLDGANRVKDLVALAARHEMPAVALTDHGVMHGAVEFYTRCTDAGVKPIVGCEIYTSGDRPRSGRDPRLDKENYHLLLLAQNETGYKNLIKIVSRANTEGFYYKPRADHELLAEHAEGLICTCACLGGEVQQALINNQYETARDIAAKYRDIFTPERYFIELQTHGIQEEAVVNEGLLRISKDLDLRLIVTNDIHYGKKEDAGPHDVLLCIGTASKVAEQDRLRYPSDEFYFKNRDEMASLFPEHPDALHNTVDIASMIDFKMSLGDMILPHYNVPEGHTYDSYFEQCCWEGAKRRYPEISPQQRERIEYEMGVIKIKGYSAYFLIVADFVRWAHARGIPARCRGSAAGSVVSYLLGITNVDPMKYGLLFERFLYMERITPPDIDLDFADYRREEVIQYCRDKYGPDHVAQIITFGTLGARAAIRDVSRAMELPLAEADKLAKLIPQQSGKHFGIEECLKDVPELRRRYEEEPTVREVLDNARAIEGLSRHSSVHAAGVVITPGPITDYCPVQVSDGNLVTQYDMSAVSNIGLLKMDFLGLRTLTVVEQCVRLMQENHPEQVSPDFDIDAIPKDDPKTFALLQAGNTAGVFQLESSGMRSLVMDIRPDRFEDIIPLVALYRPGPLGNGDTERFIKRRHGLEKVAYIDPCLEPVLKDTYGIFVYQEQIMKVAMQVAGMGAKDADDILRAMSKKKADKMAAVKPVFIEKAIQNANLTEKRAQKIFDSMASFAAYGFNMNHSGAYAILTYQTAWLKANYPTEFMAALLTSIVDNTDKVVSYIDECKLMGLEVKAPDVNRSQRDFSVDQLDPERKTIRFGLLAIRGVGEGPVASILECRKEAGLYRGLYDFCARIDLNRCQRSTVESIIKAGGFDSLHPNRGQVLAGLEDAFSAAQRARKERDSGQVALFGGLEEDSSTMPEPPLPNHPDIPQAEKLALEKELLGIYLSDHPYLHYQDRLTRFRPVNSVQLKSKQDKEEVVVAGIICNIRKHITRQSRAEMCFLTLEDLQGKIMVTLFPRTWEEYKDRIKSDTVVVVKGKATHRERVRTTEEGDTTEVEVTADELLVLDSDENPDFRNGTNGGTNGQRSNGGNGNGNGNGDRQYARLNLDLSDACSATIDAVKKVLRHYPGNSELVVSKGGHRVRSRMRVMATADLAQEMARLLGTERVWLE